MPYLTPQDVPVERDCRALFIPASSEWLAIVSGALTELSKSWNWQQEGITVDETLAVVTAMIDQYYAGCSSCTLPDGEAILRIGANGHIEQLVDGEWVEPQGDYALPPTPPRGEATEDERLCAAAANAANVLMLMYENVSDSFNSSLSTAAAIAALAAWVAANLGSTGFGLAIAALIAIGLIIFGVFYALMEFITADMWTEDFNEKLKCVLLACASDDGDVVHFDYDCVINELAAVTDLTLSFDQVRLFGQIYYLLSWIGAQGLDAAGATTGITEAVCDDCETLWCRISDWVVETDGYVSGFPGACPPYCSTWVLGQGWTQSGISNPVSNGFNKTFDPIRVTSFRLDWHGSGTGCTGCGASFQLYLAGVAVYTASLSSTQTFSDGFVFDNAVADILCDQIVIGGDAGGGGAFAFTRLEVVYRADDPELGEDNCP